MTELSSLAGFQQRYASNLSFFQVERPELAAVISQADVMAWLDEPVAGEVYICHPAFRKSAHLILADQQALIDDPASPYFIPFSAVSAEYLDDPESISPHQHLNGFYTYLEPSVRQALVTEFLRLAPQEAFRHAQPNLGENTLAVSLVLGGVAGDITRHVLNAWNTPCVVLMYSDVLKFLLSLCVVDYAELYQIQRHKGGECCLVVADSPENMAADVIQNLEQHIPAYFLQASGVFIADTEDPAGALAAWQAVREKAGQPYRSWGFVDDELLGIRHALDNLQRQLPMCQSLPELPAGARAVIVGNGPSLDATAVFLREQRDSLVIFAAGSAATALGRLGIAPDFVVLIERTEYETVMLQGLADAGLLQNVPILAVNVVSPRALAFSSTPLGLLKTQDAAAWLVDPHGRCPQFPVAPSCANAALACALAFGFADVFLLGMDVGFRDTRHHHSKASLYYLSAGEAEQNQDLQHLVSVTHQMHSEGIPVPANFGGEVLSTPFLMQTRDALAAVIALVPQANVFNLSDGARIPGAIALPVSDVYGGQPVDREMVRQGIQRVFKPLPIADAQLALQCLVQQCAELAEAVRNICARPVSSRYEVLERLVVLNSLMLGDSGMQFACTVVRGGVMHLGRFFMDAFVRLPKEAEALEYFAYFGRLVVSLLAQVTDVVTQLSAELGVSADDREHVNV